MNYLFLVDFLTENQIWRLFSAAQDFPTAEVKWEYHSTENTIVAKKIPKSSQKFPGHKEGKFAMSDFSGNAGLGKTP